MQKPNEPRTYPVVVSVQIYKHNRIRKYQIQPKYKTTEGPETTCRLGYDLSQNGMYKALEDLPSCIARPLTVMMLTRSDTEGMGIWRRDGYDVQYQGWDVAWLDSVHLTFNDLTEIISRTTWRTEDRQKPLVGKIMEYLDPDVPLQNLEHQHSVPTWDLL